MEIDFKEEQKFTQWWLWLILLSITLLPLYGVYLRLFLGNPIGDRSISNTGLVVWSICGLSISALFWLMKLKTVIDDRGIWMNFFPFVEKRIYWEEIRSTKIINYGFVGGWGIRLWTKYGTVYNTKGNIGIAIMLISGKRILIGTQKENELVDLLKMKENTL